MAKVNSAGARALAMSGWHWRCPLTASSIDYPLAASQRAPLRPARFPNKGTSMRYPSYETGCESLSSSPVLYSCRMAVPAPAKAQIAHYPCSISQKAASPTKLSTSQFRYFPPVHRHYTQNCQSSSPNQRSSPCALSEILMQPKTLSDWLNEKSTAS